MCNNTTDIILHVTCLSMYRNTHTIQLECYFSSLHNQLHRQTQYTYGCTWWVSSIHNPNSIAFANVQQTVHKTCKAVWPWVCGVYSTGLHYKAYAPFNTCKRLTWIFFLKVTHPSKWISQFQHGVHVQKCFRVSFQIYCIKCLVYSTANVMVTEDALVTHMTTTLRQQDQLTVILVITVLMSWYNGEKGVKSGDRREEGRHGCGEGRAWWTTMASLYMYTHVTCDMGSSPQTASITSCLKGNC